MIYKSTIEDLTQHSDDTTTQVAIAINHHYSTIGKKKIALTTAYRHAHDLKNNRGKHKAPGFEVDITLTNLDEYGEPTYGSGKEYASNGCIVMEHSKPSAAAHAIAVVRGPTVYLCHPTFTGSDTELLTEAFDSFPFNPMEELHETKFKTKPGRSLVVLSYNHDEINEFIRKEIANLETGMLGNMVKFENGFWKPSTYLAIWSTMSELYTCILLNEQLRDKGSTLVWLPVNMRGECSNKKIGDLKGKIARWADGKPRKKRKGSKENMELYVEVQMGGADLTLHRLGSTRFHNEPWPTLANLDVKLDHYAAQSNRIFVETHVYSEEQGFEKSGWLWKRNKKEQENKIPTYITYQVDNLLYTFKIEDLVKEVNDEGTPTFEEYTDIHGRPARRVMGRFNVNTADTHCTRTGMGKYGFYITLDKAHALATRIDDVLPAMLHDVEIRSDAYFDIEPEDEYPTTKQKWVRRMVQKSKECRQQRT